MLDADARWRGAPYPSVVAGDDAAGGGVGPKGNPATPRVRHGQPPVGLSKAEFRRRFLVRFSDPAYARVSDDLERVLEVAWEAYSEDRKSPRTRPAGEGFADPGQKLSEEWLETRRAIEDARERWARPQTPTRVLVVCGSSRSDQTCPGEISKSFRLATVAEKRLRETEGVEADLLDLSRLASEYGRVIYPCKACVSTAMPLCHWPCSCYPNHAIGQTNDWMNEIYPRWVEAHGVLIVAPVNWYQSPSALKLMVDRLVCADGGNPDPTTTDGKDPEKAKALEMRGWHYPRHLAGRAFAVVVHGDAAGVDDVRRALHDWLVDMKLVPAGPASQVGRYVGYYRPYATSHDDLDADEAFEQEVRNAADAVVETARRLRRGECGPTEADEAEPRPK
jgi:multimeric flavodoxin WrbA